MSNNNLYELSNEQLISHIINLEMELHARNVVILEQSVNIEGWRLKNETDMEHVENLRKLLDDVLASNKEILDELTRKNKVIANLKQMNENLQKVIQLQSQMMEYLKESREKTSKLFDRLLELKK